jgi:asparagine synthetase B (glutamine-hydrolysing)
MKLMVLSHFQCLMECSLSVFMIKKQIKFSLLETFWRKPLYYCKNSDSFIWASELKKILPSKPAINKTALNLF